MRQPLVLVRLCILAASGWLSSSLAYSVGSVAYSQEPTPDWRSDWAVRSGLGLEIDALGFSLPTALAFVPQPGSDPDDALYFVTELEGAVKVVTNDRTVSTFARDFFTLVPAGELPAEAGEVGLAGICLAPAQGFVFVTFAYQDTSGVLRNGIVRFETGGPHFATEPLRATRIAPVLSADASSVSHQIGPCQVSGETVFVSVGDGHRPDLSRNLGSTLGKILRLDLDGRPVPGNPFLVAGDSLDARSYVWAYGLRNPFSLKQVHGRLFAADNGLDVDRFLEVEQGEDYHWDGTEWSIGSRGAVFVYPSVGPVQMEYVEPGVEGFPTSLAGRFLIATAGLPTRTASESELGAKGILAVDYDLGRGRATGPPEVLLQYRGEGLQAVVGLAAGLDGLYLAPIFPNEAGETAILRLRGADSGEWPWSIEASRPPRFVLRQLGCLGCHAMTVRQPGEIGPLLQRDSLRARLTDRLFSPAYLQQLSRLDSVTTGPHASFRDWRDTIRQSSGEQRLRHWVYYQILDSRFDDPNTGMPMLGASESEAALLRDYLLGSPPSPAETSLEASGLVDRVFSALAGWGLLPRLRYRLLPIAFALGLLAGVIGYHLARVLASSHHSERPPKPPLRG